jgi:hypothetical protein
MLGRALGGTLMLSCLATLGCSGSDDESGPKLVAGFHPDPLAEGETQLLTPVLGTLEPGGEEWLCNDLDFAVDTDVDLLSFKAFQSPGGHHTWLYTTRSQDAGDDPSRDCGMESMQEAWKFVAGGGEDAWEVNIPEGLALRLPAGSRFTLQTHFINITSEPIEMQAAFNLRLVEPIPERQLTDMVFMNTDVNIPPGTEQDVVQTCVFEEDLSFWLVSAHAHATTKHVKTERINGVDGTTETVFEVDWLPEYYTNLPVKLFPTDAPMVFKKGDTVRTTCHVNNLLGTETLTSPFGEMCGGVYFYFPSTAMKMCFNGNWLEM